MAKRLPLLPSDLRALAQLALAATQATTDLVEDVHHGISHPWEGPQEQSTRHRGVKGQVYGAIRTLTALAGAGVDHTLARLLPAEPGPTSFREREAFLATLNGILGDRLAATGSPLAIPMTLRVQHPDSPTPTGSRLLILVHGLCRDEGHWNRQDHDHGAALARDLGVIPLYLRYNSGLHVSTNGKALAALLEETLGSWPGPVWELSILAHSMGGLVARSACQYAAQANHTWLGCLQNLVFLGTPHHGAPLERGGHLLEKALELAPFTGPFARLGTLRSEGITDLRHGNLLDSDWQGHDRFRNGQDHRLHLPLPRGVRCCAVAGTTSQNADSLQGRRVGDGLVPLDSALGVHSDPKRCLAFAPQRTWIGPGLSHLDLLSDPGVYAHLRQWLVEPSRTTPTGT